MTNQQFEEWVKVWVVSDPMILMSHTELKTHGKVHMEDIIKLAHAIRNKVLHEAIEVSPKEIFEDDEEKYPIFSASQRGFNRGINEYKDNINSLLKPEDLV